MNPPHAKHYESVKLADWIKYHYGTVYNAAKQTSKTETQLHRWIKKGALIDVEGRIWTNPAGGSVLVNR